MESTAHETVALSHLPTGARLLFRSRNEWRAAAIAEFNENKVSIHVASPSGRTYRIYRPIDSLLIFDGRFFRLTGENPPPDKADFTMYDPRW